VVSEEADGANWPFGPADRCYWQLKGSALWFTSARVDVTTFGGMPGMPGLPAFDFLSFSRRVSGLIFEFSRRVSGVIFEFRRAVFRVYELIMFFPIVFRRRLFAALRSDWRWGHCSRGQAFEDIMPYALMGWGVREWPVLSC
jgi:hypothetical protein